MEECTIVFDVQRGEAYRMEEGKLFSLGKGALLMPLWKDTVYQIGERLFIRNGDNYQRIASNSRLIAFDGLPVAAPAGDQDNAEKNVTGKSGLISAAEAEKMYLQIEVCTESLLPEFLREVWWRQRLYTTVLPMEENAFLIDSDKEFRLFMIDQTGIPRRQISPLPAVSGNSFIWNGYGYVLVNGKFCLSPLKLVGLYLAYALFLLGNDVYSLDKDGFHSLGASPDFHLQKATGQMLMIAEVEHGKMCCQLCEQEIKNVCLCSSEDSLEIDDHQTVHHRYKVDSDENGPIERHRLFRPDETGIYIEVKE